jgi:cysteine-rich repeat protein
MTSVSSNASGIRRVFSMLGLIVALAVPVTASAHTVEICWQDSGGVTTFYAGTYHGPNEAPSPVGGIIVDGFTFPFSGWIYPSALPSTASCASFDPNQQNFGSNPPAVQHYQTFTSGFAQAAHTVSFTSSNVVQAPWGTWLPITFGGGACTDADFDGICNDVDACPLDFSNDADNDGFCANVDNCPLAYNPSQTDANNNGQGDVCEGDVCGNGLVTGNEQCDDGNIAGGDGCSAICTVESVPPTCSAAVAGPYNVTVGTPFFSTFTGDDAGGGTVTMALLSSPAAATLTPASGAVPLSSTLSWTPTAADFGQTYTGSVQVTSGSGGTATCPLQIVVAGNNPPIAEANGGYIGSKSTTTTVTSIGTSDSDGSIVSIEWDCLGDGNFVSAGTTPGPFTCPVIPLGGIYTATVRVTDDQNATATDTATITVQNIGPTAEANGPYSVVPAIASVTISGAGSVDGDGGALTYAWDCDTSDGTSYTVGSTTVACTYANSGTAIGSLQVCDPEGMCDTDGFSVLVNSTPVGVTGGPYEGDEGVPVPVDGSGSGDIDGTVVQWEWDCHEDGTFELLSTSSPFATCTYDDNGVFAIGLRVTDNDGGLNTVITTVAIDNLPPVITSTNFPSAPSESISASFSGSATDVSGDTVTYAWDFGDGGTATGASATHIWANSGDYIVTFTASDEDGGHTTVTTSITVGNLAPTIDSITIPATGVEEGNVSFASLSSDVGTDLLVSSWDFGDGSTAGGGTVQHAYGDQGTYTVTLTVTDQDGAATSSTGTIVIANLNPQITSATIPSSGDEAEALVFSATGTDVVADTLTYTWSFGDGSSAVGSTVTHVYADNGTVTVSLLLQDEDGGSATTSANLNLANVNPQISNVIVPATGGEGMVIPMSADAVDATGEVLTFVWDYGDGTSDTYVLAQGAFSSATSHAYADEGTYNITITVTDDDGGFDIFNLSVVTVSNLDPVVSSFTVPSGNEGDALNFDVVATDAPGDPLTYQWDFGDGTTATGDTATHIFTDNGNFTVTMTIQDDGEGGETVVSGVSHILNVDPTIEGVTAPSTGGEGEALLFEVTTDDAGIDDLPDHLAIWTWGDGTSDVGASLTHAYIDQGTWTVTLTVDDGDTGQATQTMTVVTENVAPTITSTPPTNAVQGTLYTYQVVVDEPGDDVLTFTLAPSAPAGMTINSATGLIEFTGTYAQSQGAPFTIVIGVDDGEGGVDGQVYTLTVLSADTDGDGIADDWETANGLDPNDSSDGNLDYDLDGLTNVEEFGLDQDPFSYDGPSAPVAVFPIAGEEVDSDRPDLTVDNAVDPNNDVLIYEFEVYSDIALANFVTGASEVAEDASGQTFWKVDISLLENTDYWWRASANDGAIDSPWSQTGSMFINTENDMPDDTALVWPIEGEVSGSLTPELEWTVVEDIDRDSVTYDVEVLDEAGEVLIASATGVTATAGDLTTSWVVDLALDEDTYYTWRVLPVDEHGLEGNWTDLETFFSDATNEAPTGIGFLEPADGVDMADFSPALVASEGLDPEGTEITYLFEVDTVSTFDGEDYASAELPGTDEGSVTWDLAVAGITLPLNATTYARVRGTDEAGIASAPDTISFFVRGDNDAPGVPVLVSPEDGGSADDTSPELVVETPVDPEGDTVFIEFIIATDIGLTEVIGGVDSVVGGEGMTSWVMDPALYGRFYWSARSFDIDGATSDWAEPWVYIGPDEVIPAGDDDDDDDDGEIDCSCSSSLVGPDAAPGLLLLLLALPGLAIRRRR